MSPPDLTRRLLDAYRGVDGLYEPSPWWRNPSILRELVERRARSRDAGGSPASLQRIVEPHGLGQLAVLDLHAHVELVDGPRRAAV